LRLQDVLPALSTADPYLVCIAVEGHDAAGLFRSGVEALGQSRFLEFRFDSLPDPGKGIALLSEFCRAHPQAVVLATCRRVAGGGGFSGSVQEQLGLLVQAVAAGASLVDVELETLEVASTRQLEDLRQSLADAGALLLVSAHDFAGMGDLEETLERLKVLGSPAQPAIYKVVATAHSLADNLRMLRFIEGASRKVPIVGLCMGEVGLPSRVLSLRAGGLFTFGANGVHSTAAGQPAAATLLDEYRLGTISEATRVYGVAGNPVAHSLSPAMHNAAFHAAAAGRDTDAVYLPLHTTSVADLIILVRKLPVDGLSVTMPWKIEILPHLDVIDSLAARIGAVNTVVRREDGTLFGTNTDAAAVVEPLKKRLPLKGARILLLGAGGAARAAAFGLRAEGAHVSIANRTALSAEALARDCEAGTVDWAEVLGGRAGCFDVVVQATPAGMLGREAALPMSEKVLQGIQVLFEMVYRPVETPLVHMARELGIEVVTGVEMFAHQGARQWEFWTGKEAPLTAMYEALELALLQEELLTYTGVIHGKI